MALWASYTLATTGTDLQVTVQWRTTQNGPVIQTDVKTYSLTDRAVVGDGPTVLADRITRDFRARAAVIDAGVAAFTGVQTALGANQGVVFQVL